MTLEELRAEIDRVDRELLPLFLARMDLVRQVAEQKRRTGVQVQDPTRERQILEDVASRSGAMKEHACRFYAELLEISRSYQETLISQGGPNGSGAD